MSIFLPSRSPKGTRFSLGFPFRRSARPPGQIMCDLDRTDHILPTPPEHALAHDGAVRYNAQAHMGCDEVVPGWLALIKSQDSAEPGNTGKHRRAEVAYVGRQEMHGGPAANSLKRSSRSCRAKVGVAPLEFVVAF